MNAIVSLCVLIAHIMWFIFCIATTKAAYNYYGSMAMALCCTGLVVMQLVILWSLAFFLSGGGENLLPALLVKSVVMFFLCYSLTFGDLSCAKHLNSGGNLGSLIMKDPFLVYHMDLPDDATAYEAHQTFYLMRTRIADPYDAPAWMEVDDYIKKHGDLKHPRMQQEIRDFLRADQTARNSIEKYGNNDSFRFSEQKKRRMLNKPWLAYPPEWREFKPLK